MTMMMPYGPAAHQERPGGPTLEPPASQLDREEASVIKPHQDFEPPQRTTTAQETLVMPPQSPTKRPNETVKES